MFGLSDDVRPALRAASTAGQVAALATLHTVVGGGPRPPGTQMLLAQGIASGFLSGGCIEADIALHAAEAMVDGEPRHLVYGQGSPWADIRLLCGARIEILIERVLPDDPATRDLLSETEARRSCQWITDGRTRRVSPPPDPTTSRCAVNGRPFELRLRYEPVPRLIVIGSDPVALAIASLGSQAGFETTLNMRDGPESPPPIPNVAYNRSDPAEALAAMALDASTSVAVATHDLETDRAVLLAALPTPVSYVGVLGAESRVADRLRQLRAAGLDELCLRKLRSPIGIDLGGKAPWEIAISVIGQIIASRNGATIDQTRLLV